VASSPRRSPFRQPGKIARLRRVIEDVWAQTRVVGVVLAGFALLLVAWYVYAEVTRDVVIIDPFSVPKRLEEKGLTGEAMANKIGDSLQKIESLTHTRMKKDNLCALHDDASPPDVEVLGTKLSLKTIVEITRNIFGVFPKHVGGDVLAAGTDLSNPEQPTAKVTVNVYVRQGRNRSPVIPIDASADDLPDLARRTAEAALRQVNP
jgi:hypothetical protein